jgi:hypothetical protein
MMAGRMSHGRTSPDPESDFGGVTAELAHTGRELAVRKAV